MKRIALTILFGAVWFFLAVVSADAGGRWHYSYSYRPGYSYYHSCSYQGQHYDSGYYYYERDPVVVTQYVYVPVASAVFPTYQTAALVPQQLQPIAAVPAVAPVDPCAAKLAGLMAQMAALEARMAQGASPAALPRPEPSAATPKPRSLLDGKATLVKRCAVCHDEAHAEKDGGGFTYFKGGDLLPLAVVQLWEFDKQILSGKMPKGGKLEPDEGQAIIAHLHSLPAKKD